MRSPRQRVVSLNAHLNEKMGAHPIVHLENLMVSG
jgi:hypothetical protein